MSLAIEQEQSFVEKQPIKWMELPIMKFNEVAIPHHVNQLKILKANIVKCQRAGDWPGAHREQANANVAIKQLRILVKEMDALRCRVTDSDVHKFDKMINNSRQRALNILQEFIELQQCLSYSPENYIDVDGSSCNKSFSSDFGDRVVDVEVGGVGNQLQKSLEVSRLADECQIQERYTEAWQNLQKDIIEVHQMYHELAKIVETQGEAVNCIETEVESAQELVQQGEKELLKASRLKVASYPLTGAVIGSIMGGPVGIVAGFKLGSIVALTCSILGFTGGKLLKQKQISE